MTTPDHIEEAKALIEAKKLRDEKFILRVTDPYSEDKEKVKSWHAVLDAYQKTLNTAPAIAKALIDAQAENARLKQELADHAARVKALEAFAAEAETLLDALDVAWDVEGSFSFMANYGTYMAAQDAREKLHLKEGA